MTLDDALKLEPGQELEEPPGWYRHWLCSCVECKLRRDRKRRVDEILDKSGLLEGRVR